MVNFKKIFALLFVISFTAVHSQSNYAELTIKIKGFENTKGLARVALFNSEETFASPDAFMGFEGKIDGDSVISRFKDVPFGFYGIAVFHDENENEDLDFSFLGFPIEDYGFSNDAEGFLGPPSWKDAEFEIDKPEIIHYIKIN